MSQKIPYIRVGTTYYKVIEKPLISGDKTSVLVRWNRETIVNDHGKTYVSNVPKFDGFCCIPEHLNYQQIVQGFYNIYNEIPFAPSSEIEDLSMFEVGDEIVPVLRSTFSFGLPPV